jgi:hypothetical protein
VNRPQEFARLVRGRGHRMTPRQRPNAVFPQVGWRFRGDACRASRDPSPRYRIRWRPHPSGVEGRLTRTALQRACRAVSARRAAADEAEGEVTPARLAGEELLQAISSSIVEILREALWPRPGESQDLRVGRHRRGRETRSIAYPFKRRWKRALALGRRIAAAWAVSGGSGSRQAHFDQLLVAVDALIAARSAVRSEV